MYAVTSSRHISLGLGTIKSLAQESRGTLISSIYQNNGSWYVTTGFRSVEDLYRFDDMVDRLTTPIVEVKTPWHVRIRRKIVGRILGMI